MSDNEIDAELLAMAGSDSSDREGEADVTQQTDDRSPTPEIVKPSVEKTEETGTRRGVAQRVRAKKGRKVRTKEESEEVEEEGEASASPAGSLGSGAMEQSESEADAPGSPAPVDDEDAPLYPIEGRFMSASDRDWLLSLPELEREQELDRRAQEVIRKQQDLQLKRALASTRAKASSHKRKAADAELDDGLRKSSRPKVEKSGKSALDNYKKAREQAGVDRERRDGKRAGKRGERSPSEASDQDADGESEVEWAEPASDKRRDEPVAELVDFQRCRVGRSNFAKVCFYPGFDDAIRGCFCRVSIGPNRETGENTYRMAQIKGFGEGKPYQLESQNGKKFLTDQYAIVAQGKSEKLWPFLACSDSKFTHEELERYVALLKSQGMRMPPRKLLYAKVDDINGLLNRSWTDNDIQAKINKQKAIEKKYDPANAANLAREKILNRRKQAEENGDYDEISRCEAELAAFQVNSTNGTAVVGKTLIPTSNIKSERTREQDRLAQLNQLARKSNAEEVRKALVEERRVIVVAREKAIAEAKAKAEAAKNTLSVPSGDMKDLFGDGSDISRAGTPVNALKKANASKKGRPATPSTAAAKKVFGAVLSGGKTEDDIIGDLDLGIDIEI